MRRLWRTLAAKMSTNLVKEKPSITRPVVADYPILAKLDNLFFVFNSQTLVQKFLMF